MPIRAKDAVQLPYSSPPNFAFKPVQTRLMKWFTEKLESRPKLLSIVAPIGYGKTVLMTSFYRELRRRGENCIWVGLDERHKTVDRIIGGFKRPSAQGGGDLQVLLQGDTAVEQLIDQLIEYLAEIDLPATIFIDNLNSCLDERLGAALDALVFRTASSLRFVWSSTSDPQFNFGRARLEGMVRQIGLKELSLTAAEVAALLGGALSDMIGHSNVQALLEHTEGWPAAVRLAQIVLSEADQPVQALSEFSGTDEEITALLKRRIMSRFDGDMRYFLLCLGQLQTFSVGLCSHAIGLDNAHLYLDYLLQRNLFMIPLDRNRNRYRLHAMFREYLLTEGERLLSAGTRRDIKRRASQWCEKNKDWHDALEYALDAEDMTISGRLLDVVAGFYVREQSDVGRYIQWVQRFEDQGGAISWETHFWYVWALVFQRKFERGRRELDRLIDNIKLAEDKHIETNLKRRVMHLQMCLNLFTDHLQEAEQASTFAIESEAELDAYSAGSIRCIRSICLGTRFEFQAARQTMLTAQPMLVEVGGPYTLGWISLIEGALAAYEGDVANGYRDLMPALNRVSAKLGREAPLSSAIASVASYCAVEMGDFAEARKLLGRVLPNLHSNVLVDHAAFGLDAAVKLWRGEDDDQFALARFRELVRAYPPRLALMFSCFLIQRYIALGRLEEAETEAQLIGMDCSYALSEQPHPGQQIIPKFREVWSATLQKLLIASRQLKTAEILLARDLPAAKRDGLNARVVELELASASVSHHLGKTSAAGKSMVAAVRRAARRRILRPFFDYRDVVQQIVELSHINKNSFVQSEESLYFVEICAKLGTSLENQRACSSQAEKAMEEIVAPTPKEAELLALLDTGLTNIEIANYTNVSVTTVKWHLKNLYRKLNVANRAAALARARDLGLLGK